jgi:hypothetical protein
MSSRGKKIRYEGDMGLFGENNSVNPKAWSMQDSQIIAPQNLFPFCAFFFVN